MSPCAGARLGARAAPAGRVRLGPRAAALGLAPAPMLVVLARLTGWRRSAPWPGSSGSSRRRRARSWGPELARPGPAVAGGGRRRGDALPGRDPGGAVAPGSGRWGRPGGGEPLFGLMHPISPLTSSSPGPRGLPRRPLPARRQPPAGDRRARPLRLRRPDRPGGGRQAAPVRSGIAGSATGGAFDGPVGYPRGLGTIPPPAAVGGPDAERTRHANDDAVGAGGPAGDRRGRRPSATPGPRPCAWKFKQGETLHYAMEQKTVTAVKAHGARRQDEP